MDFDKLLDDCATLENTISILVKNNATKQAELSRMQNCIFDNSQICLDESVNKEKEFQRDLDNLKHRKNKIETEIRQFTEINEKLSELVSITQRTDSPESEGDVCKYNELYYNIIETVNDYEQNKLDYIKYVNKIERLDESFGKEGKEIKNLIKENENLVAHIHGNDSIIRLSDQQYKYAEQQFDLILNQLPWEPLTEKYINGLKKSKEQSIRDLAGVLQIQASEIEDLSEAIDRKKKKKLEVLEELHSELNVFLRKRDEAVLMANLSD